MNGGLIGNGFAQDDNDSAQGDLLNGVGSASSHTSTASSIFSSINNPLASSIAGTISNALALTPLTNTESSPAERTHSPPLSKSACLGKTLDRPPAAPLSSPKVPNDAPSEKSPIMSPPDLQLQARPTGKQLKGLWCTYDPELDKTLSSKEKKKLKPVYKELGLEVRSS